MKAKLLNFRTLFFLIGFAMLSFMVYNLGFQTIADNIAKTAWWFTGVLGIWLLIYYLNALACYYIIGNESKNIGFNNILKITISGFAINNITPFLSLGGEPYKVLELNKHLNKTHSTSTIISYNMMHIFSHFFFWLTAVVALMFTLELKMQSLIMLIAALLVCLIVICLFYLAYKRGIVQLSIKIIAKIFIARIFVKKIKHKQALLEEVDAYIIELYKNRKRDFYYVLFLEYIARIIGCLEYYFILKAISMDISLYQTFLISAGSSLFANIFFFVPMQIGSRESGFYLVFESMKLTPAIGVYASLITRIRELFWTLIGLVLIRIKPKNNIIEVNYE